MSQMSVINLVTGSVRSSRVGHGVTVVSVSLQFDQKRPVFEDELFGPLCRFSDSDDVHSVDEDAGNVARALVELGRSAVTIDGGSHSVLVVFAHENSGQFPELEFLVEIFRKFFKRNS
jgi:hypothetical protein